MTITGLGPTLNAIDRPAPAQKPRVARTTGNPVLDQLDTNGDGVISGLEHDFFLESEVPQQSVLPFAPASGLVSELFPSADPDTSK